MAKSSRNTVPSQTTNASLLEKHSETVLTMATAVHGMAEANKAIEMGKETMQTMRAAFEKCTKALRADKVKIGKSRRTCSFASMFYDNLLGLGIKATTANNYLTSFRMSVNEGRVFTLNAARDGVSNKKVTVVPPAAEATKPMGTVITPDVVRELQNQSGDELAPDLVERDSSNGTPVQAPLNTNIHNRISENVQIVRRYLAMMHADLGNLHMKGNQAAIDAVREELNRIESEVLEAAKR